MHEDNYTEYFQENTIFVYAHTIYCVILIRVTRQRWHTDVSVYIFTLEIPPKPQRSKIIYQYNTNGQYQRGKRRTRSRL